MNSVFVRRVTLRQYKSIEHCDVRLGPLTILVGANGAGKSNFVDALCFVRDALRESLDFAFRNRSGIGEVRRRSGGHPTHIGIRLDVAMGGLNGHYAFEIKALPNAGYEVKREQCVIREGSAVHEFDVAAGEVKSCSARAFPAAVKDRLYLVNASGLPQFRPLYDSLSMMGFYNLNPTLLRDLQEPDEGILLEKYGVNLASVIARLERSGDSRMARISEYLSRVAPSVHGVQFEAIGPKHTMLFRQDVEGQTQPWKFWASNMSDGTLRALGVLTAVFQRDKEAKVSLVAIEEPEAALHPAAARVLLDSLIESSAHVQILLTSHSADLLDREEVKAENLLAVESVRGVTRIGAVDRVARDALKEHLFTAGELLRQEQLTPDPQLFDKAKHTQDLFGAEHETLILSNQDDGVHTV